jgi:hypothetical protein
MQALYRSQSEDTSVETDKLVFSLLRSRSIQQRLIMGTSLMRSARNLSLSALRYQYADLAPQDFSRKVAEAWLQEFCPVEYIPTTHPMVWIQDSIGLASLLHPIFDRLSIRYYITGGVAAIAYGEPRTTQDLDLVLEIEREAIQRLATELEGAGFYVPGLDDAVSGRMRTLQVTHMESISRADLVIAGEDSWDLLKFDRRWEIPIEGLGHLFFASPEDLILNKLRWGQRSQSEKQWRDVQGIFKVKGSTLDFDYLKLWAERLALREDLDRVAAESGWAIE